MPLLKSIRGCAAALLRCPADRSNQLSTAPGPAVLDEAHGGGCAGRASLRPVLYGWEAMLLPDTLDALRYYWDDARHKNSFIIERTAPQLIGEQMPTVVDRLLSRFRLKRSDIAHWVSVTV